MEREIHKSLMLRSGYTIKDGYTDLKPYVYEAADRIANATTGIMVAKMVLSHIENKMVDLYTGDGASTDLTLPDFMSFDYVLPAVARISEDLKLAGIISNVTPPVVKHHSDDHTTMWFAFATGTSGKAPLRVKFRKQVLENAVLLFYGIDSDGINHPFNLTMSMGLSYFLKERHNGN